MNISVKMTKAANASYHGVSVGSRVSIDIEEYLRGVVPVETDPDAFPLEALKAQAIAARTMALYLYNYDIDHLTDSSSSAQSYSAGYHRDLSDQAIEETEGIVLGYSGKYILAQYCSSNGGRTVAVEGYPYLIEQDDPWTAATHTSKSGHGHGMSQVGAKQAAKQGRNYQTILLFYYDNSRLCWNYDVSWTLSGELKDDYDRSEYFDDEDYDTAHLDFGTRTLKYVAGNMMTGTDVRNVQTRLKFLCSYSGAINGIYNIETRDAVKKFQKYEGPFLGGLTYDGIVGTNTKKALKHPCID